MSRAIRLWPLLTGTQRYEKVVSTRNRGHGEFIDAPILAYLIETRNGRILYDVGCDYRKIANPALRSKYFDPKRPRFEPPEMSEQQRIPHYLGTLGLSPADIDVIFLGHLHFDHAGGLCDLPGCEVHVHRDEVAAARSRAFAGSMPWLSQRRQSYGRTTIFRHIAAGRRFRRGAIDGLHTAVKKDTPTAPRKAAARLPVADTEP
jgi:glyoxylase-like metal-dependent hydrolase (beta-lactamase superfamily II)